LVVGALCAGGFAYSQVRAALTLPELSGTFRDSSGKQIGTARVMTTAAGVMVNVEVRGLTPGLHGAHVHTNGNCATAADPGTGEVIPFGATAGHFDPYVTRNHGAPTSNPKLRHAGVLPNLEVGADGVGRMSFETGKLTISGGMTAIADRAIVIHANQDDYETDPAGNSGGRVACAELRFANSSVLNYYKLPAPDAFPEGIVVDARRGVFLTGASNGGDIWQVSLATGRATPFAIGGSPGRTVALGMKIDPQRRLWVAAGATGRVAVLNADTGAVLKILEAPPVPLGQQPFVNDLILAGGYVYVTDSNRPILYRARAGTTIGALEPWLRLDGTAVRYQDGTNLNGVVASADGRTLVTVQSNTGKLFRIDIATRAVREISGVSVRNGDGLVLSGTTLHVVRNANGQVDRVAMNAALTSGRVTSSLKDPEFRFPTTAALQGGQLLVVNGQLDKSRDPPPVLPFTIVRVPVPSAQ
jgi:Cu-Zn family superoxide dismutase